MDKVVAKRVKTLTLPDYCYICDADLANPHNASSHYKSARHKSALKNFQIEEKKIIQEQYSKTTNTNLCTSTKKVQNKENIKPFQNQHDNILKKDVTTNTESISYTSKGYTDTILMQPPVKFVPDVIRYLEEEQILREYENLRNLLINTASQSASNQVQEKIKLELVLEMEKLIHRIYTPNHLPLDFILSELRILNSILNSCKADTNHEVVCSTRSESKSEDSLISISSCTPIINVTIIGVVMYIAYKCLK